ncbi:MAG: hypothetical protein Q9166_006046 [cf. Caloplaca sp. 2 TL-2023]
MTSEESIWEKAAANIHPLDDPYEKKREHEQIQFMSRVPKAALASILSSWVYFGYSFKCLLDAQFGGLSGTALKVAWLSYALQIGQAIPPGTPHLLALSAMGKAKRQPLLRLAGDVCPTVDIFITYCGEELDVLLDTVRAATALNYPKDSYRIIVLDDSVSVKVETEVGKLRAQYKRIYYSTRGTKPKTHTKAGNLNHGLKYVSRLPGGASDLVSVLDVDMIPSPHWLRALVPHLLVDHKVALANPPQRHYNIPDGDPLGQSMDILFDVMEPSKNATSSAWCCGSGFVVRRDALDGIGGVPEESINEDILTSFFLKAAGWEIVYVHEDVQWGLVPSTITAHIKQQKRVCAGIISTAAVLWNPRSQTMTSEEKYGALFPAFSFAISVIINMAAMITLPLLMLTGAPLVAYFTDSQLRRMSYLFLIKFLAVFSYDFLSTQAAHYHLSLLGMSMAWTIPYQSVTLVRFALSILTSGGVPMFTPSGVKVDLASVKTVVGRIKVALWDDGFIVHIAIIGSLLVGLAASMSAASRINDMQDILRELFIRAGWPQVFLIWSAYMTDCSVPLYYACNPPQPMKRNELMDRDPTTQLAYPNRQGRDQLRTRPSQTVAIMKICYCVGACALSMCYVPQGSESPTEFLPDYLWQQVLRGERCYPPPSRLPKPPPFNNSYTAMAYRANYASTSAYTPGSRAPSVTGCDVATLDVYLSGTLLSESFENTIKLFTNGSGT